MKEMTKTDLSLLSILLKLANEGQEHKMSWLGCVVNQEVQEPVNSPECTRWLFPRQPRRASLLPPEPDPGETKLSVIDLETGVCSSPAVWSWQWLFHLLLYFFI